PSGKEYQMLFKLNAQANSGFKSTFTQAQAEFARLGSEIQSLNRVQADISAYQKQSAAIDSAKDKIANLTKQHELLSRQIEETTGSTAGLEREKLKLEQRMASAQGALERQEGRLSATSQRLEEAGVNTADLAGESARLTTQIEELSKEQEQAARSAQEYGDSATSAFQAAGEALAAAGIVAGLKEIGESYIGTVQAAGEFGATMSNAEALSGANASQMAALTAQAKELGATTKFTANEAGEAMGYMGMAGWNARQMLSGMPGVLNLAAASGEDLAGVADIVTDSLTGFKLTAADTGEFVDVLATAATKSNTNVSMLGESFKYAAPLAGTLGYSAQDTAVALGLMANSGIKASQAGTTLRTAISNMISPTKDQAAEMERLDISLTDTNGQMLPMLDMVGNLRGAFSGMSEAERSAAASTIFGKEAMSGMLAIINASEADYQSLTQSINNSAGAAKRMADIKLDNLAGDLTLLNSAADGLSLTIGEQFMPQTRALVQAGTGVISFVNELIDDHPVLTKAIMGAAGAVGAVTTAVVALNAAKKVSAALDLAAMFTGPVGPILAAVGAFGAVTAGIIGMVEAANEGVPKVDELTQAAREAAGAVEQVSADFDTGRVNIMAAADVAGDYIGRLEQLDSKTSLTKEETQEYHNILALLCETVPELAESIDLTTNSVEGGTEALREQTEAWKKNAEAQAYQEAYKNMMAEYSGILVDQADKSIRLTEAEKTLNRNLEKKTRLLQEIDELYAAGEYNTSPEKSDYYDNLGRQVNELDKEIRKNRKTIDNYRQALDENSASADEAKSHIDGFGEAMQELAGETGGAVGAVDDVTASVLSMSDSLRNEAVSGVMEASTLMLVNVGGIASAYSEAYSSAYDSISGQMGLFETMSVEVQTSVDGMISSLQSQVEYMSGYSENLRTAAQMGVSDGLLSQLSDGSTESAAYLQEIVTNGQGKINELNAAFAQVEKGKEDFSSTVADMQKDLQGSMDEAVKTTENAVREMDMYVQAAAAARSTMQGFIDGANGMAGAVQAAYRSTAYGAVSAMQAAMGLGVSVTRGYASGTENAERGFALVGEDGPEVVFFRGGEQVLNARETAAMQAGPAMSALPAGGYGSGGIVITLSPVYNLSGGMEGADVRRELSKHNDSLRELILEVLEDARIDSARRRG
ncbi:phage tail tape measure protein, partial [Acutalibacter muris]|uniref:phage tail tape measure protein n=1 Tax=Acutalibacter muris TaxID=1796620 RepID=UPI002729E5C5